MVLVFRHSPARMLTKPRHYREPDLPYPRNVPLVLLVSESKLVRGRLKLSNIDSVTVLVEDLYVVVYIPPVFGTRRATPPGLTGSSHL